MKLKYIRLGQKRVAYHESPGNGPAVILVHGNSMSGLSFQKQFESKLGDKYRLIAPDLPGHGISDDALEPAETYTLPGYAETLVSFVNHLGLQKAFFAGFSLAGHIVLEAADRLPASGIMIIGAPAVSTPSSMPEAFLPNLAVPLVFKPEWTEDDMGIFQASVFGAAKPYDQFTGDISRADGRSRQILGESIMCGEFRDEVKVLADIKIPVAVVLGEHDALVNGAYVERLNIPTLWDGKIQVIPEAGHMPQWDQSDRFNDLLGQVLNGCG